MQTAKKSVQQKEVTPTGTVPKDLVNRCLKLLKIDKAINNITVKLKAQRKEKNKLMKDILVDMKALNFDSIKTDIGNICIEKVDRPETMNKNFLQSALLEELKDKSRADELSDSIMKGRKMKTKDRIKISGREST